MVNLHDWIDELCDVLDIEVEVDEALILDLARDSAHNVERRSAPITTFLLGYAAAGHDGSPVQVERLSGLATALALRWDKAPEEIKDVGRRGRGRDRGRRDRRLTRVPAVALLGLAPCAPSPHPSRVVPRPWSSPSIPTPKRVPVRS